MQILIVKENNGSAFPGPFFKFKKRAEPLPRRAKLKRKVLLF
jgi:hypothetical protein